MYNETSQPSMEYPRHMKFSEEGRKNLSHYFGIKRDDAGLRIGVLTGSLEQYRKAAQRQQHPQGVKDKFGVLMDGMKGLHDQIKALELERADIPAAQKDLDFYNVLVSDVKEGRADRLQNALLDEIADSLRIYEEHGERKDALHGPVIVLIPGAEEPKEENFRIQRRAFDQATQQVVLLAHINPGRADQLDARLQELKPTIKR